MDKTAVRQAGRRVRREISGPMRTRAEALIRAHLLSLPAIRESTMIGAFVAHDGEPDQQRLIERLRELQVRVALPTVAGELGPSPSGDGDGDGAGAERAPTGSDVAMRYVEWTAGDELVQGRFGIPVPAAGRAIDPDVVLVPFTGFDADGHRIGRGRGFFDRFLGSFVGQAVGVGFEAQRFDRVPVGEGDVALATIVTDLGVRHIAPSELPC